MIIPATLKIGGLEYSVEENESVTREGAAFGTIHTRKQKIFLDPNETQQKKEQTLIHEIFHALWFHSGLHIRYEKDKSVIEEEIITAMSNGIFQAFKDNDLLK